MSFSKGILDSVRGRETTKSVHHSKFHEFGGGEAKLTVVGDITKNEGKCIKEQRG